MSTWNLICHLFVSAVVLFGVAVHLWAYTIGAFFHKPSEHTPLSLFLTAIIMGGPLTAISLFLTHKTLVYFNIPEIVYQIVCVMAWVDLGRTALYMAMFSDDYGNNNSSVVHSSHVLNWMITGFGLYLYWAVG